MYNEETLLKELDARGIKYEYHAHAAVFTVDQADALAVNIKGAHCKNLFVKNSADEKWILTLLATDRADLKSVAAKLGSSRLSFCSAEEMEKYLGVIPGAVTPLAILNDAGHNVSLIVDKKIAVSELVGCHPLRNTATIVAAWKDIKEFIENSGHKITIMNLCADGEI